VWLGTVLYTLGGLVAYRRRAAETGLIGEEDTPDAGKAESVSAPQSSPSPKKQRKSSGGGGQISPQPARATTTPNRPRP